MLRISVTTIETFRNYLNGSIELEDLLKKIRGEFIPSRYMELGSAFHDILEQAQERYIPERRVFKAQNGIEFSEDIILRCQQVINREAIFEIKATKFYYIGNETVEVVAKADQLLGNYIYENKTCWGIFDYEKYFNSCQWRFYLDIFEAEKVCYNVFCLTDNSNGIELKSIEQFSFSSYSNIKDDLNELLRRFLDFIFFKKLEKYFFQGKERDKEMNIQKIKIANLLGIEELEFEPGKFTLIEGRNGSGKTSILESIKHALNGGHDAKLLRNGADKGEIVLVLDDGMQLTKTITPNKSDVKILDKEGNKISKPQTYIDKLIDMLSVNPVMFLTADKKNRANYLLEAIPMKLTREHLEKFFHEDVVEKIKDDLSGHALEVIDGIYKKFYDERTGVNRALKEKVATMIQLKDSVSDATNYSSNDLLENLKTLENKKGDMEAKKSLYLEEAVNSKIKKLDEEEVRFQEAMMRIREEHEQRKREIFEEYEKQRTKVQVKFDEKYLPLLNDIAILKEKLQQSKSQEKTKELIEQFSHECSELKDKSTKLTQTLNTLEDLKNSLLKNLPIKGLEIKNGEIYYNNIVFDKLNTAEQVKIAVEIAKIRAGKLGIICVDGLEKLDRETFNEFKNKAIESGLQMIVTKVSDSELNIQTEVAVN